MNLRRSLRSVLADGCQSGMVALAIGLAVSLCGGLPAAAQPASESETIALGRLFEPDVAEVLPDAGGKLADVIRSGKGGTKEHCYPTTAGASGIEIGMGATEESDDLFLEALFRARRAQLLEFLRDRGLDPGQLAFQRSDGPDGTGQVELRQIPLSDDTQAPELKVTSAPRKGTKVAPGDIISVTIRVRERKSELLREGPQGSDATSDWQSGIQSIQLTADNGLVEHEDYGRLPDPCSPGYLERVLETSYTVPANPPPIVQLRAITSDYAGNQNFETGEFPTGEWYGKQEWTFFGQAANGAWTRVSVSVDLALDPDSKGNLTGTAVGRVTLEGFSPPVSKSCLEGNITTTKPGEARARPIGSYTPGRDAMSITYTEVETVSETRIAVPCMGTIDGEPAVTAFREQQALQHLKQQSDGSFHGSFSNPPWLKSEIVLRRAGK